MSKETGGPAFPWKRDRHPQEASNSITSGSGMELRDYFAAKAMSALLSSTAWVKEMDAEAAKQGVAIKTLLAFSCYEMADAMLEARGT